MSKPRAKISAEQKEVARRLRSAYYAYLSEAPRKVSQSEVAEMAGMKGDALSDLMTAQRKNFSVSEARRLARVLGVRAAWLAFGDEPRRGEDVPMVEFVPPGGKTHKREA